MSGFGLRKNMAFDWSGVRHRIDRLQPNGEILVERVDDGCLSIVARDALLRAYTEGHIVAASLESRGDGKAGMVFSRPLDELSEPMRNEMLRRRHYLQAILEQGAPVFTQDYLQPFILEVAARINDAKPPSPITLWRWYRRYRTTQDARALIPRIDRRGSHNLKQDDRILQLATDAIQEAFNASPRATGPIIYSRLLKHVAGVPRQR